MTLQDLALVGGLLALLWPIVFAALAFWLSRLFVTQKEFNGLGERVTGVQKVSEIANEQSDMAVRVAEGAERTVTDERRFSEERHMGILRAQETISATNERTATTLQAIQLAQERAAGVTSKLASDLERLSVTVDKLVDKLLDALDRRMDPETPTRNRG